MNVQKLAGGSIRVLLISGSVFALMLVMSVVLRSPVRRTTLAELFILGAAIAILLACAWVLRKFWMLSGTLATMLVAKKSPSASQTVSSERKEEGRA
ncbi:MAG: hypothetical protein WCE63_24095 [Acidobacteriaceae bacterium]